MTRNSCLIIILALCAVLVSNISCKQEAVKPQSAVRIGAYYFPFYDGPGPDGNWDNGTLRSKLSAPQMPRLGAYRSRDETVIKQHLAWAEETGISFFALSWWGQNTLTDGVTRDYFAPYLVKTQSGFKFCILYMSPYLLRFTNFEIPLNLEAKNKLLAHFLYLAETYFAHPNYLKIDNRPVVFLYLSRCFRGDVKETFNHLRTILKNKTTWDIYLVGDEIFWTEPEKEHVAAFDAITTYHMHGPARYHGYPLQTGFFKDLEEVFSKYQTVAQNQKVGFIPNVMPGFNDRGARAEKGHPILPREIGLTTEKLGSFYRQNFSIAQKHLDPQLRIIMITSWNEWHEDTQIEPSSLTYAPVNQPTDLTGGYDYYGYDDLYLKITKEEINK
jgi:hypothetical protein